MPIKTSTLSNVTPAHTFRDRTRDMHPMNENDHNQNALTASVSSVCTTGFVRKR